MKSQVSDWLFLYNTIQQVIDKKLDIKLKIFYFTLEMSKEEKMRSAFSNLLYIKEGVRIAPIDLRSTKADKVLSLEHIALIEKNAEYFKRIEEIVTFVDDIRNPTGIFKFVRNYAYQNGVQHKKTIVLNGVDQEIDDYYEPNDPEEYVMVIIDHISLINTESEDGKSLNLHGSIVKLSSKYLVQLRNKYNYIPVVIQQQAAAQESVDNKKANKLKPSLDGLGDCKLTARDANVIIGVFSPFRHEIKIYPESVGYDITFFRDNIRFAEIIGGREGGAGTICPMYFDGAVNYFKELPLPTDTAGMKAVYRLIHKIREGNPNIAKLA